MQSHVSNGKDVYIPKYLNIFFECLRLQKYSDIYIILI